MLNASRRFRYTLDLKKEEEKEQIRRKIRAHAQVIRVFGCFHRDYFVMCFLVLFYGWFFDCGILDISGCVSFQGGRGEGRTRWVSVLNFFCPLTD